MESVHNPITDCAIHGYGAADSGEWPKIKCDFDMVCSRDEGSPIVTWDSQLWDWTHDGGVYGYKIAAAIAIDPDDPYNPRDLPSDDPQNELWYILEKAEDYPSNNWWNYVTEYHPGPRTFNCPKDTATMYVYVKSRDDCMNGGHWCFNSAYTWTIVASYTLNVPRYESFYTVSYNANGGTGTFPNQTKSSASTLTLHSTVPTYPVNVNYYNQSGTYISRDTYYRAWGESGYPNTWKGSDNGHYAPSGSYTTNANCTMTAIWGNATAHTRTISSLYYRVTYNYNGGTGSPSFTDFVRTTDGYATSYGGAKVYSDNANISISSSVNLYPRYGNATLTSLPTPTRTGYMFSGWYTSGGTKVSTGYTLTGDITLTARWNALPIHQFKNDGTWDNNGPYVWRFNGTSWEKVAHLYKYNGGNSWTDLSQ